MSTKRKRKAKQKRTRRPSFSREVMSARVTNSELAPEFAKGKMPRLDVNCEFNDGQKADIELRLPLREANDFLLRRKSRKAVCFATRA